MLDGYTARNIMMFLYPSFGLFVYRHYRSYDVTPWIAIGLSIFLLFTIPYPKYFDKPFMWKRVIKIYHEKKKQENLIQESGFIYVPKAIKPQGYNPGIGGGGGDHAVNMVFRIFIWEDMISELIRNKAWFGMGLSHPLRSPQLEKLHWAEGEWGRDGWISAHNSYIYVIYRLGIIGVALLGWLLFALYRAWKAFWRDKRVIGLLLMLCLFYWMFQAGFQEQLQVPYYAIPFWSLTGLIFNQLHGRKLNHMDDTSRQNPSLKNTLPPICFSEP
jgi:hypothetical protein